MAESARYRLSALAFARLINRGCCPDTVRKTSDWDVAIVGKCRSVSNGRTVMKNFSETLFRSAFAKAAIAPFVLLISADYAFAAAHSGITGLYSGSSSDYTCARLADNRLSCWGTNDLYVASFGIKDVLNPRPSPITDVTTGDGFACMLFADGQASCWGANTFGQLGTGDTTTRLTPTPVMANSAYALTGIMSISAGSEHACAVNFELEPVCWGHNNKGQLGNYSIPYTTDQTYPSPIYIYDKKTNPQLLGVFSISAGTATTCVVFPDYTGACWGDNEYGQLGDGAISSSEVSPVGVIVPGPVALTMMPSTLNNGGRHTCAIILDGSIGCWGDNSYGETSTGLGGVTPYPASVFIGGHKLTTATALILGGSSTCVILNDQTGACWGANWFGEVGNYKLGYAHAFSPYTILTADGNSLGNISQLVGGEKHFCALTQDGKVYCWGDNTYGQLGAANSIRNTDIPQLVPLDPPIFCDGFNDACD